MRVESGPAKADRNWSLISLIICIVLSAWFVYDGAIGWPQKNREEARKQLAPLVGAANVPQRLGERPTRADFKRLQAEKPSDAARMREILTGDPQAEPFHVTQDGPRRIEHYVSDYGEAAVPVAGNRVLLDEARWTVWHKPREEIRAQFYWAIVPLPFALYFIYRVYRAATLRVVVDDEGLTYGGRHIPLEAITAVRDFNPKGWVDLYYRRGASERRLRLDNQKIDRFEEIVAAVCQAKGFDNPLPAPASAAPSGDGDSPSDPAAGGQDAS